MDELARLRAFVRTAELGSFSAAARDTRVEPSSISRAVAALETDLGAALFNRSTRQLNLTEIGAAFLDRARRILADLDEARALATDLNAAPQGLLRLNLPNAFGRLHVMPYLPVFAAAHPRIRFDVTLTDITVDLIASGADLAIRIGPQADTGLVAHKLAPHRRVLCAAPALLSAHPIDSPQDLSRSPALLFSQQPDRWFVTAPTGNRLDIALQGIFRANDSEALLQAAIAGLGVALLPTWLIQSELCSGALIQVLPDHTAGYAEGERFVWAVHPPKRVVPPKVRTFIDGFAAHIGSPPRW